MGDWRRYLKTLVGAMVGVGAALYVFTLVVDPYDNVWFSPPFEREPISSNQRYSFPALARAARFDSAIIGTSTTRLLRPAALDPLFDARFVNLSMNSATAYEQAQILGLFARRHDNARVVIFGVDQVWCDTASTVERFTFRPFPPWMYDDDRWNDLLYLFNFSALEQAGRQFAALVGLRAPKYGRDGYTDFLPPDDEYDLARARAAIYPAGYPPAPREAGAPAPAVADWSFPTHGLMAEMLAALPRDTLKLIVFAPYHHSRIPPPGTRGAAILDDCKSRLTALASAHANAVALDFMLPSPITREDRNYWDPLHYTVAVADRLAAAIAAGAAGAAPQDGDIYRRLGGSLPVSQP